MRPFLSLALAAMLTLGACSAGYVESQLTAQGWTPHAFRDANGETWRILCAPTGTDPAPRAATAFRRLSSGIDALADRAADDLIEGRIGAEQMSVRINRETDALLAQVEQETGCLPIDISET